MSNITRNKTMITARNQFKSTKEGAITYAEKDVDLAYAHGFSDGKKLKRPVIGETLDVFMLSISQNGLLVTAITRAEYLDKMQFVVAKDDFIESCNDFLGTNYNRDHLNNFLSDRKPTPQKILAYCRYVIAKRFVDSDIAEIMAAELV